MSPSKTENAKKALIIVDVQNDFITGSLALSNCPAGQDGAEVVPIVNELVKSEAFDLIVATQDWHPENHISFVDNLGLRKLDKSSKREEEPKVFDKVEFDVDGVPRPQILWPRHCVQHSPGSQLHPDLRLPADHVRLLKGQDPDVDSYSAFWDNERKQSTGLEETLRDKEVKTVYFAGLATDVCVKASVMDAVDAGFDVFLFRDAVRGVDDAAIQQTFEEAKAKGVKVIESTEVLS